MLDEIIAAVDRESKKEITITKGLAFIIVVVSFFAGVLFGSACAGAHGRRKLRRQAAEAEKEFDDFDDYEEFDAGEYVKSLNLDD